jgi:hypothetical protein
MVRKQDYIQNNNQLFIFSVSLTFEKYCIIAPAHI